jgi:acyl-CoA thioester hydrolase
MMRLHPTTVELEVPFHDCDPLGVVWHGHYYKYMELARTRLLTGLDLDGAELLQTGHRFFVIESHCRYAAPLRYRDRVAVTGWIRELEHRIVVAYELCNQTMGRRAARGHTILATVDTEGTLLLETPHEIRRRLGA